MELIPNMLIGNTGLLYGPKGSPKFLDCESNFYFQLVIAVLIEAFIHTAGFFYLCAANLDLKRFNTFVACELNLYLTVSDS